MLNLDYKCFRDVLNYIHKHLEMPTFVDYPNSISILEICNAPELSDYSKVQIKYTIMKLIEADFVCCHGLDNKSKSPKYIYIDDITIKGYSFLANSMNKIVWNKALLSIKSTGIVSLNAFCMLMDKIALKISINSLHRI